MPDRVFSRFAGASRSSVLSQDRAGERQLNVLEFYKYADTLGADAAEQIRTVARAKG